MRKIALLTLIFLLAAGAAFAGSPGTWTYGGGEAALISFAILDIASIDANTFVAAGLYQGATIDLAWKSVDGGETLYTVMSAADSGGFSIVTGTGFFNATTGLIGGINFVGLKAGLWRSTGGGEDGTWTSIDLGSVATFGTTIDSIETVNDTFGLAVGSPNLLFATNDGGATWTQLTSPLEGSDVYLNGTSFINEEIGFIGTGYTPEKLMDPSTPEGLRHNALMRASPLYRMKWEAEHQMTKGGKAVVLEGIYKTVDGGASWEELIDAMNWYCYRISMPNEQYGACVTGEYYGDHGDNAIRYTTDGGYTWDLATLPNEVPWATYANYIIGDIWMIDSDLGYAPIMFGLGSIPVGGAFLITTDGGKTWDWDSSGTTGVGYMGMSGKGKAFGAAGGVGLCRAVYTGNSNAAPTAEAGEDGDAVVGVEAMLDGSGSSDPDGDTLSYKWVQTDGAAVTMPSPWGETNTFTPTAAGTVTFQLTVTDSEYWVSDEVTFNVTDAPTDDTTDDDTGTDDDDDSDDDAGTGDDDDDDDSGGCCG